jgi:autotransporter-associated beta strand protein
MLNLTAQAVDKLWIGSASDHNVSTASNWTDNSAGLNFDAVVFGSDVVDGTMQLNPWAPITNISTTSGLTIPVTIEGSLILTGGTTVTMDAAGGDLTLNAAFLTAWGDISMNVGAGRTLTLNGTLGENSGWGHPAGINNAGLVKNGAGTAVITSAAPTTLATETDIGYYTKATTINAGTLQLGDGTSGHDGSLPSITTVTNNASLVYNLFGAQTAGYVISGSGTLTKSGIGALTLSGVLGYGGGTTVDGGKLIMPGGAWQLNGIANSPITVNAGGTLELPADPSEYSVAPTLNGGTITSSGVNNSGWPNITLSPNRTLSAGGAAFSTIATWLGFSGSGTISVGSGSTLSITGPLTGNWITARTGLFKTGEGTLTLSSAASDYDCDTTISEGTLALGGDGRLNSGNYGYNITNNAEMVYGSSAAQTLSGAISGSGTITQNSGTLTLSGTNTYSGATTVNGGYLAFSSVAAVGSTSEITVNGAYGSGGHLRFDSGTNDGTISTPISVVGGNYHWHMSVAVPSNLTFTGPINLSGGALIVSEGGNSTLNFNNALHGTGGLTFAALSGAKNFFVLSATCDFSGNLAIVNWNGSPQVTLSGGDDRLPTTALVSVNGSSGMPGALDLNGNNQTIAGLTDSIGFGGLEAGARSVVNTSGTVVTLTLNTTNNQSSGVSIGGTDINGTIGDDIALVKSGAATQTLSGANSYSGDTTVAGGTLSLVQVNSNNESSTVSIAASAGAKLDLAFTGTDTVDSLYINGVHQPAGNYTSTHASGAFTGGGTLYVTSGPAGYATWKAENAPTGIPSDDYDEDGVSNGVEFVIGGTKDTNDLSKLPAISINGGNLVFSFQRSQDSIDGSTTLAIQVSSDLISWSNSYNVPSSAQINNLGVTVSKDTSAGFDTIILTVPRALNIRKFARLVVTPAP